MLIAAASLLLLSSCGNSASNIESKIPEQTDPVIESSSPEVEKTPAPSPIPSPEPTPDTIFEPNEDLQVVTAFVYDNDTYVVVENTGTQPILNYRIAYINFDKNGFVATRDSDGYERGKNDTANLMPGDKDIGGWYGADGIYAVAAVVSIDYADGTTWEANEMQVENWAKEASNSFSVEEQKNEVSRLKETGSLAETNEFASLTDYTIKHGNQFSSDHDLHFSLQNTSDQGITRLNIFVLEFDKNGFPVAVNPYDTYCINGHQTGGTVNLASGASSSYSDDLFISSTTTQIKGVISYIEFQDGSEWNNPYLYEWILGNCNAYET